MNVRVANLLQFAAASGSAKRRLVCLPFAGGTAATYRLWPATLPADVEVRFAQLPGRDLRGEAPLDSIEAMAAAIAPAIDELDDLPYAIFGHSMGGLVAFELTAVLERAGSHRPQHVFISSRRPPDETESHDQLHLLDDTDFVSAMRDRYQAIPDVVASEPELLAMLLPLLRADVHAFETYRHGDGVTIATPLHVFGGRADTRPPPDVLRGWQRFASNPITIETFPGGHFYLNEDRAGLTRAIGERWVRTRA